MKKVLIIAYYWPPAGGGGVQRWLKFVKYLPEYGWEPVVYAPDPKEADYPLKDESLIQEVSDQVEVIRRPIWEPRKVYQRFVSSSDPSPKKGKVDEIFYMNPKDRSIKQDISLWIRGNIFIPDARVFWVSPSVTFLKKYLKTNPVDAIVTTGPPHSMHLIGMRLKRLTGITWIADFRDPWTDIEFYDKMMLSKWADKQHRKLEKQVHQQADAVIKVSPYWINRDQDLEPQKMVVITNGYDEEDFAHEPPALDEKFLISHVGTLANDRNPRILWEAIKDLEKEVPGFGSDLQIQVMGKTDASVLESAQSMGVDKYLVNTGYVAHSEAIRIMQASHILLLLINDVAFNAPGRMTGKIFEYLAARRPILLIGPVDGDAAQVIADTQSGASVGFGDLEGLKKILTDYYALYKSGSLNLQSKGYEQYARRNTTRKLAELLEEVRSGAGS